MSLWAIENKTAVVVVASYRSVSRNPIPFKALIRNKQYLQRGGDHRLQAMKIVHHHANDCFDWLICRQQSVSHPIEAISILPWKYKRFTFVYHVGNHPTSVIQFYFYSCKFLNHCRLCCYLEFVTKRQCLYFQPISLQLSRYSSGTSGTENSEGRL